MCNTESSAIRIPKHSVRQILLSEYLGSDEMTENFI